MKKALVVNKKIGAAKLETKATDLKTKSFTIYENKTGQAFQPAPTTIQKPQTLESSSLQRI